MVVGAIVGAAGLKPVIAAVRTGCVIALANKEALVMSGQIFLKLLKSTALKFYLSTVSIVQSSNAYLMKLKLI